VAVRAKRPGASRLDASRGLLRRRGASPQSTDVPTPSLRRYRRRTLWPRCYSPEDAGVVGRVQDANAREICELGFGSGWRSRGAGLLRSLPQLRRRLVHSRSLSRTMCRSERSSRPIRERAPTSSTSAARSRATPPVRRSTLWPRSAGRRIATIGSLLVRRRLLVARGCSSPSVEASTMCSCRLTRTFGRVGGDTSAAPCWCACRRLLQPFGGHALVWSMLPFQPDSAVSACAVASSSCSGGSRRPTVGCVSDALVSGLAPTRATSGCSSGRGSQRGREG
jgi:hypothetical protein